MPRSPGFTRGEAEGGRPALTLRLAPGWRIADSGDALVSTAQQHTDLATDLPRGSELVYAVPGLAEAGDGRRSPEERELARTVMVILPAGGDERRLLAKARRWPGVERAWIAPRPSLP